MSQTDTLAADQAAVDAAQAAVNTDTATLATDTATLTAAQATLAADSAAPVETVSSILDEIEAEVVQLTSDAGTVISALVAKAKALLDPTA